MTDSAEQHLQERWLIALGSTDSAFLKRRLLWDGRGEDNIAAALRAFAFTSRDDRMSAVLQAVRKAVEASAGHPLEPLQPGGAAGSDLQLPFVDLWRPVATSMVDELQCRLRREADSEASASVLDDLERTLLTRLCNLAEHALAELFQAARGLGAMLLAHVQPDEPGPAPPREAYLAFIEQHRREGLSSLLATYPVLARLVAEEVMRWFEASVETLRQIEADRALLLAAFGVPVCAPLVRLVPGLGDPHRGGRTATLLRFEDSQGGWQLVYKPRDLGLDAQYHRTLRALHATGDLPPLRSARVLERPGYGYVQWVARKTCRNADEVRRFYRSAGRLSALLYVLGATDCHNRNLIADGDQLVLVDPETLFEPPPSQDVQKGAAIGSASGSSLSAAFDDSIVRCGVLPSWRFAGPEHRPFDASALGSPEGTAAVETIGAWKDVNTDQMRWGTVERPAASAESSPVPAGQPNPFPENIDSFCAGFAEQCANLVTHRSDWLRSGGLLDGFAGMTRRMVLRPTGVYATIHSQQLQPEALRSEPDQRLDLEQLARLYLNAPDRPRDWPMLAAEIDQMRLRDIPYFSHRVGSTDLPLDDAGGVIAAYFAKSGLDACRSRLEALDESTVRFQLEIVRGSVGAAGPIAHRPVARRRVTHPSSPVSPRFRIADARAIAAALVRQSFDGGTQWLGLELAPDGRRFSYGPLGPSLYSGTLGIAGFFASLSRALAARNLFDSDELEDKARRLQRPLADLASDEPGDRPRRWWRDRPLGFAGLAGDLTALLALDRLGLAPEGLSSSKELADRLVERMEESLRASESTSDLMRGGLALVGPLLRLGTPTSLHLVGRIAGRARAGAARWLEDRSGHPAHPIGFSSGTGGIIAALGGLHQHSGDPTLREMAEKLLLGQRKWVEPCLSDPNRSRAKGDAQELRGSWCHGLAGAALGCLCLRGTALWNDDLAQDTSLMLRRLGQHDHGDHSLCCGASGGVAVLRIAARVLGDEVWRAQADRMESALFASLGDRDGEDELRYRPGLMMGAAGLGLLLVDEMHDAPVLGTLLGLGLLDESVLTPSGF